MHACTNYMSESIDMGTHLHNCVIESVTMCASLSTHKLTPTLSTISLGPIPERELFRASISYECDLVA